MIVGNAKVKADVYELRFKENGTRGRTFDWSPRDGPTPGRCASVPITQTTATKKPTQGLFALYLKRMVPEAGLFWLVATRWADTRTVRYF